ncbi:MarR family winged helix-turn-helix transcriptional regulator [Erythrobacter ani]|uniref:MarR family transcriptional regulator n=1 Tax=Erythrobacter ani TaxID=2827235 RepID=A0ABS6SLW6_9SPHN|nr:MarR family transcriptional regulator [Erythrobacter ani]MBV7265962.1 MarR family transcriptional regulator [Erythrobacter ani]
MIERTANLLGVVGVMVADAIEQTARDVVRHAGETPAALVVIGYGFGPSNDRLRRILGLSHPGTVRLVDRLVRDNLVERRPDLKDRRSISLHLTPQGEQAREAFLKGRLAAIAQVIEPLSTAECEQLTGLLRKMLSSLDPSDEQRCYLCRLCDDRVCTNCPIPADFRADVASA